MRLLKNIIANVIGKLWSFVSIFLFIPLYVKILGIESYSIIAFYTVLQTFLTLVDVGLAATLNREFAKTTTSISYKANLLRTFEYIYILLAGIICCCTFIFARQIASEFLNADTISTDNLTDYIRLMGLIVGCNIFVSQPVSRRNGRVTKTGCDEYFADRFQYDKSRRCHHPAILL